ALAASFKETATSGPRAVTVGRAHSVMGDGTVELSGQTAALVETPIYTRTDGYVRERAVDIGQKVKKGDLLILLDTPDLDQQIDQARATLAQAKAALSQLQATVVVSRTNAQLAKLTADRTKALADEGVLSRQQADNATAAVDAGNAARLASEENTHAQEAVIAANEAALRRLQEQKKYARMEAPFDGVITYRNPLASEVGTLISSGSSSAVREVMRESQVQTLRVFVDVPQSYVSLVHVGQAVGLTLEEFSGKVFRAEVKTSTGVMDPASRAMVTELRLDNSAGTLVPGMYVKAQFKLDHKLRAIRVPAEALITSGGNITVAVVDDSGKVHLQPITLGRDFGAEVEATSGVNDGDRVVLNPPDTLKDGSVVDPKERAKQ
ncbi:MAG: efflux RND transporter periplasmic adaptor subunit, partial [Acidobacteriota bacterium]